MPDATVNLGALHPCTVDRTGAPASLTTYAVLAASVGLLLVGAVGLTAGGDGRTLVAATALVPASVAAALDIVTRRLPGRWLVATALLGVFAGLAHHGPASTSALVVGAVVAGAPLLLVHLAAPTSLGFGDVRFAAALGLVVGAASTGATAGARLALTSVAVASAAAIVVAAATGRHRIVFGPFLVVGVAAALCWADPLGGTPLP